MDFVCQAARKGTGKSGFGRLTCSTNMMCDPFSGADVTLDPGSRKESLIEECSMRDGVGGEGD